MRSHRSISSIRLESFSLKDELKTQGSINFHVLYISEKRNYNSVTTDVTMYIGLG